MYIFLPLPHLNQPFLAEMSVSAAIFCTNNGSSSIMLLFGQQIINRTTANTSRKHKKATQGVLKACVSTCEHPKKLSWSPTGFTQAKIWHFRSFWRCHDGFAGVSSHFNSKVTETAELAVSPFLRFFPPCGQWLAPREEISPPKKCSRAKKCRKERPYD